MAIVRKILWVFSEFWLVIRLQIRMSFECFVAIF